MSNALPGPASFPCYTRAESVADGIVHGLGLTLLAVALPWMLWTGFIGHDDPAIRLSLVLYAVGAVLMFGCSALYNALRQPRWKELFRRFDRAAIFIMIAGTYSPLAIAKIGPPRGTGLMAFEWSLACLGATLAIVFPRRAERILVVLYLLMGWAILIALGPLMEALGSTMFGMILIGGLIYTAGVGIHSATRLKFHNALWHVCVLCAASCHYVAILVSVAEPIAPLS